VTRDDNDTYVIVVKQHEYAVHIQDGIENVNPFKHHTESIFTTKMVENLYAHSYRNVEGSQCKTCSV
jgi:hypothetical protein